MRKIAKLLGLVLACAAVILVFSLAVVYVISAYRFNLTYDVQVLPVAIPGDAESIVYGEHVASIWGCKGCHGEDLSGQTLISNRIMVGVFGMSNLTGGAGGAVTEYTVEDWVRSIRHGIGPDSRPLLLMPSHENYRMSDEDLGALLAYILSLPPVDNEVPDMEIALPLRVLYLAGPANFLVSAELIDHDAPRPATPERGVTAVYGEYLAGLCRSCHGTGFSGGPVPGAPPDHPPALNLTPAGELAGWTFENFLTAMRTGVTPSGRQLRDEYMPYQSLFGEMTDEEWEAIWLYLQSLPPIAYGNR